MTIFISVYIFVVKHFPKISFIGCKGKFLKSERERVVMLTALADGLVS